MQYGIRSESKAYAWPYMIDCHFHCWIQLTTEQERSHFWANYIDKIRDLKPVLALAVDYMHPSQKTTLYRQIDALQPLVETVLVCPKFNGAVEDIPDFCRIALSVPSPTYAGFLPDDFTVLKNKPCHLLGGRPEKQADVMRKVLGAGGDVISTDGNYSAMKAGKGQWFNDGQWTQLRGNVVSSLDMEIASAINIVTYLNRAYKDAQPQLI